MLVDPVTKQFALTILGESLYNDTVAELKKAHRVCYKTSQDKKMKGNNEETEVAAAANSEENIEEEELSEPVMMIVVMRR